MLGRKLKQGETMGADGFAILDKVARRPLQGVKVMHKVQPFQILN